MNILFKPRFCLLSSTCSIKCPNKSNSHGNHEIFSYCGVGYKACEMYSELGTPMVGYSKLVVDMSVVFLLYVSFSWVLQLN